MLSSEIASTLGGRFVIMNIYPYSFSEYLTANGKEKNYLDTISTSDKSQGMKQLMAGGGVALIGTTLVPLLAGLF